MAESTPPTRRAEIETRLAGSEAGRRALARVRAWRAGPAEEGFDLRAGVMDALPSGPLTVYRAMAAVVVRAWADPAFREVLRRDPRPPWQPRASSCPPASPCASYPPPRAGCPAPARSRCRFRRRLSPPSWPTRPSAGCGARLSGGSGACPGRRRKAQRRWAHRPPMPCGHGGHGSLGAAAFPSRWPVSPPPWCSGWPPSSRAPDRCPARPWGRRHGAGRRGGRRAGPRRADRVSEAPPAIGDARRAPRRACSPLRNVGHSGR